MEKLSKYEWIFYSKTVEIEILEIIILFFKKNSDSCNTSIGIKIV